MDPRIGWHPNELISEAFSTWTNVWMIAQMNCTTTTTLTHSQTCNVNNTKNTEVVNNKQQDTNENTSHNYDKLIALLENAVCTCNSASASPASLNSIDTNAFQQSNPNPNISTSQNNASVTSQTILNGLKSRKFNKASTFGYNFPINQHVLSEI